MSAQVVIELNGEEIARVPLAESSMVIGRDPSADIHLDNLALSRRHAQIERRGAAHWIRDLGSQNGTYVNGERVDGQRALRTGDAIEVGRYTLSLDEPSLADELPPADSSPVVTVQGPEGEQRFAMVGDEIIIGRSPTCDIPIRHKSISRQHLRITREGGRFIAEDLGSQNGTLLRGQPIHGPTPFALGDALHLSDFVVELSAPDGEDEPPADDDGGGRTMMIPREAVGAPVRAPKDGDAATSSRSRGSRNARDDVEEWDLEDDGHDPQLGDESFTRGRPLPNADVGPAESAGRAASPRPPARSGLPATARLPVSGRHPATGRHPLSGRHALAGGPPGNSPKPQPPKDPAERAPGGYADARPPASRDATPATRGSVPQAGDGREALGAARGRAAPAPRVVVVHPDFPEREIALTSAVTLIAEDGSQEDGAAGRTFADQGYVVLTRTPQGLVACVAGDRRLVSVNGKPRLYAQVTDGDTIELGLLAIIVQPG